MNKTFSAESFKQYLYWQQHDEETLRKINLLIKSIECDGVGKGLGEPRKHGDCYSRRIDDNNRLVYKIDKRGCLDIKSCRGH